MRKKVLAVLILSGIFYGASLSPDLVFAWKAPSGVAPNGNTSAPINVGKDAQIKEGSLGLGGLAVFGRALFSNVKTYTLPNTNTNPDFLVGVNGDMGAKRYCDEYGQNCVSSLEGTRTIIRNLQSCRTAIASPVNSTWSEVYCASDELRTGGGCRSHGGAYSYYNYPVVSADGKQGGWACASGATGTYSEAFAVCCSLNENTLPSGIPANTAACIDPSTWTWRAGCKAS